MSWWKSLLGLEAAAHPVTLTDANFHAEVMQSDVPVLIDFWSATCGPCKQLEPIVMNLTRDYAGKVKVCEADVAKNLNACRQLGVMSTPTVLYLHEGVVVERVVGFRGSLYHREIIEQDLLPRMAQGG